MEKRALEGLKFIGFVTDGVGPLTLRLMAMYGATVIQIESEDRPDGTRNRQPFFKDIPGLNRATRYISTNFGKYGICLNMKHPDSHKVVERLVKWADVVVDNFRPGVLAKWGFGYEDLKKIKPDIIAASLCARGQTGPFARQAAYGPEVTAMSGITALSGWPDRKPITLGAYTDSLAPRFGVASILAAIDYRNRTGKGQYIDISQIECAMNFIAPALLDYSANGVVETMTGNSSMTAAPRGAYRCKGEDEWCSIAVYSEDEWKRFCNAIGDPAWTKDPRFATFKDRKANEDELNKLVESWTCDKDRVDVRKIMVEHGVQAGEVRTLKDLYAGNAQLDARDHWFMQEQPDIGAIKARNTSYILSKTKGRFTRPAPEIGQHTEYVLTQILGFSDEEYVKLYQSGALT